jgi:hypothetical protein
MWIFLYYPNRYIVIKKILENGRGKQQKSQREMPYTKESSESYNFEDGRRWPLAK